MAGPPKKLLGKPSEDSDEDDDDDDDDDVDDDDDDDDDVAAPPLEGMYDPSEFENLNVQVFGFFLIHNFDSLCSASQPLVFSNPQYIIKYNNNTIEIWATRSECLRPRSTYLDTDHY